MEKTLETIKNAYFHEMQLVKFALAEVFNPRCVWEYFDQSSDYEEEEVEEKYDNKEYKKEELPSLFSAETVFFLKR